MKTFIAISTGITAVVSLLFLTMCGTVIYSVGNASIKQEECEASYKAKYANFGVTDTDATLTCLKFLREEQQ
jgi:hypothetical protein